MGKKRREGKKGGDGSIGGARRGKKGKEPPNQICQGPQIRRDATV